MIIDIILNDGGNICGKSGIKDIQRSGLRKIYYQSCWEYGICAIKYYCSYQKLEAELNTTLLVRNNKGVALTHDGEKLLLQAEKIISLLDETSRSFKYRVKSPKIGATQTIAGYLLPQCLMKYKSKFPNVSISVHTLNQNILSSQLGKDN